MLHLSLLGPLDLRDAAGAEVRAVLQQPKRLALLAYLVLTGTGTFRRRDSVVGLFWPDLDQDHARGALRRALYFLRRSCGDGVFHTRGEEELGIASNTVTCDALEFERAARAGDRDRAHSLYRGDLLDGFYIAGAGGAEEWLDAERRRLRLLRDGLPVPKAAAPTSPAPAPALAERPIEPDVLAILPFTVRAGASLGYLREGMLDLLASALDGAGRIRVADPRAAAAVLPDVGASDGGDASAIARHLGAAWVVSGTIIVAGEHIRVSAALHTASGDQVHRAAVDVIGEDQLFTAVDELARELVAGLSAGPAARPALLAARTSASWPALKHFLQGEQAFRLGDYATAMDRFEDAVARDPTFSLGWYRVASTRAANGRIAEARDANRLALERRERLAPHAHAMMAAQSAWLAGQVDEADQRYAAIVADYPDEVEAWYLLGDVRFHGNPYRGRSATEGRTAFQHTLALDPANAAALGKLARIAAINGDDDLLDSWLERLAAVSPASEQLIALRAVRALRSRALTDIARLGVDLTHLRTRGLALTLGLAALHGGPLAAVERLAAELIDRIPSPELRAYGLLLMAEGALAEGSWDRAEQRWSAAHTLEPGWTMLHRGLRASTPALGAGEAAAQDAMKRLEAWHPGDARPHVARPLSMHDGLEPHLRCYVLGMLAARLGDQEGAAGWSESLAELDLPEGWERPIEHLQRTLEATRRARVGDDGAALRILEEGRHGTWFQHAVASPVFSATEARLLRGELLLREGRPDEASGWLLAIGEASPWELGLKRVARTILG